MRKNILTLLFVLISIGCFGQSYFFPLLGEGSSAPACQTFDATHTGSNVVLSSGNMTYSSTASGLKGSTLGTLNKTSGDWYFEIKCTARGAGTCYGIVTSQSANTADYIGADTYGFGYYSNFAGWYHQGTLDFFIFSNDYTAGDYIGIAIHFAGASSTFKGYKNGSLQGTQTINISSMYVGAGGTSSSGDLDLPTPTYSAPSGYTLMCN